MFFSRKKPPNFSQKYSNTESGTFGVFVTRLNGKKHRDTNKNWDNGNRVIQSTIMAGTREKNEMRIGSQTFSIIVSIHGFFYLSLAIKRRKLKFRLSEKGNKIWRNFNHWISSHFVHKKEKLKFRFSEKDAINLTKFQLLLPFMEFYLTLSIKWSN